MLLSANPLAEEYSLEIHKTCSPTGNDLEFSYEAKEGERKLDTARELSVVKSDLTILVLENRVYFSGTDRLHLLQATGSLYWSQFAYSGVL
ncbi:hypothetical protein [Aestuariirhabdus sp. LZHN29]|uniref:hypothetical protein n=1 Tax=Aestuariirhabdus sp. LZHN29 TaxID=3417462 RepID=UPI003CF30400